MNNINKMQATAVTMMSEAFNPANHPYHREQFGELSIVFFRLFNTGLITNGEILCDEASDSISGYFIHIGSCLQNMFREELSIDEVFDDNKELPDLFLCIFNVYRDLVKQVDYLNHEQLGLQTIDRIDSAIKRFQKDEIWDKDSVWPK